MYLNRQPAVKPQGFHQPSDLALHQYKTLVLFAILVLNTEETIETNSPECPHFLPRGLLVQTYMTNYSGEDNMVPVGETIYSLYTNGYREGEDSEMQETHSENETCSY